MEARVNYTLVGLFVIVMGAALAGAVLWLVVGTETKDYDRYRVYTTDSVAGLNLKASVKYRGVDVGQVAAIRLSREDPGLVELALDIERGTPVRHDTRAVLTTQGLTGLAYVGLTGGSRDSPPLQPTPENPEPVIEAGPSLITRLDNAVSAVLDQFNDLSVRVESLLSDQNQAAVSETLANLRTLSGTLVTHAEAIVKAMDGAAATLEGSARIGAELFPLITQVSGGVVAVQDMSKAIAETTRSLMKTVDDSRRDVQQVAASAIPEMNALLAQVRQLATTLQRFVQELDRNPRMLLLGKPSGPPGPGE